jgi:hypothetical protein
MRSALPCGSASRRSGKKCRGVDDLSQAVSLAARVNSRTSSSITEALTEEERLQPGEQFRLLHSEVRELYQRLARLA